MFKLDLQSRSPIYEQLKARIGDLVMSGALNEHDQLPSVRNFARELGINPNTVQKAYQDLERDGIIYSVSGRGSYISPTAGFVEKIRTKHLAAITREAQLAKKAGIPREEALSAIDKAYDNSGGEIAAGEEKEG